MAAKDHTIKTLNCKLSWVSDFTNSIYVLRSEAAVVSQQERVRKTKHIKWWLKVITYATVILTSQTTYLLLARLYYVKGRTSKWLSTTVQLAGFPLLLPYYIYTNRRHHDNNHSASKLTHGAFYVIVGILVGGNTSFLLTTSYVLLVFARDPTTDLWGITKGQVHVRVRLHPRLRGRGRALICCLRVMAMGTMELVFEFEVSPVFSNAVGTVGLPPVLILAMVIFYDRMTGIKAIAMVLAGCLGVSFLSLSAVLGWPASAMTLASR
ncbi:unnamed protein product [Linum tenue]|uniref:Uncharacterized protein n=1 Tax=Linum tenue TaxID=586396 RepID=A0AAV0QM59_9ROSI|nr:unnamed protein product [Linum tenue]